jgi:hypothetical protein
MPALLGVGRSGVERLVVALDPALGVSSAGLAAARDSDAQAQARAAGVASVEACLRVGCRPDVLTLARVWGARR